MDFEAFLVPVEGPEPSGLELRNDARFHAIERSIEPAAREVRTKDDGTLTDGAAAVDWEGVLEAAAELAADGRDLRLLVIVTRASANLDGFAGMAAGFDMLCKTLEEFWDSVHPQLRDGREPRDAALRRINALMQLDNDDHGLLGDLEMGIVLNPRGIGPIRGNDLAMAALSEFEMLNEAPSGLSTTEKDALKAKHETLINRVTAACRAMAAEDPEGGASLLQAAKDAQTSRATLEAKLAELAGITDGLGLNLTDLRTFLDRVQMSLSKLAASDASAPNPRSTTTTQQVPDMAATSDAKPNSANGGAIPSDVSSRADVQKCLDMIIAFYERTEPSSPIPHLARRMRKMVPMNFMELMEEIAPSGMKEFRNVAGVEEAKK